MLQYDRTDVSEGIDINKQVNQKSVCFVITGILKTLVINFQPCFCYGCHVVSVMAYELKNIAILNAKGVIIDVFYGVLVEMRLLTD